MMPSRRRALGAAVAMAAASAFGAWARPTRRMSESGPKVQLDGIFPSRFGTWTPNDTMNIVAPAPDAQAEIDKIYSQTLTRAYLNPQGRTVMLSVAYGGDQSDATRAHRPEICYPAQGYEVRSNTTTTVRLPQGALRVRRLLTQSSVRTEPVTYWVMVGDVPVLSGTEQKLAQMRYGLHGLIPDGMLVRVSSSTPDEAAAFADQDAFLRDLYAAVPAAWRDRVFGPAPAAT